MKSFRTFITEGDTKPIDLVIRRGAISNTGAYFAIVNGDSTYGDYHDKKAQSLYSLRKCKILNGDDANAVHRLAKETLKDNRLNDEEKERLYDLINDPRPALGYMDADELPMAPAAKRLGYDGFLVWENDDYSSPSSVFVWNVKKVILLRAATKK